MQTSTCFQLNTRIITKGVCIVGAIHNRVSFIEIQQPHSFIENCTGWSSAYWAIMCHTLGIVTTLGGQTYEFPRLRWGLREFFYYRGLSSSKVWLKAFNLDLGIPRTPETSSKRVILLSNEWSLLWSPSVANFVAQTIFVGPLNVYTFKPQSSTWNWPFVWQFRSENKNNQSFILLLRLGLFSASKRSRK